MSINKITIVAGFAFSILNAPKLIVTNEAGDRVSEIVLDKKQEADLRKAGVFEVQNGVILTIEQAYHINSTTRIHDGFKDFGGFSNPRANSNKFLSKGLTQDGDISLILLPQTHKARRFGSLMTTVHFYTKKLKLEILLLGGEFSFDQLEVTGLLEEVYMPNHHVCLSSIDIYLGSIGRFTIYLKMEPQDYDRVKAIYSAEKIKKIASVLENMKQTPTADELAPLFPETSYITRYESPDVPESIIYGVKPM